jgi:arylformamidase
MTRETEISEKQLMHIYDVSVPISARMPTYPGDPGIDIRQWLSLDDGDVANVSAICFGAHTGTHVDAPAHFIKDALKVESMELHTLIGEAQVIELPGDALAIDASHLEHNLDGGTQRVLFKTRNSNFWSESDGQFHTDYTYISPGAAQKLVNHGIRLVGIDYLSVERFGVESFETHEILLSNGVAIIEGLDLRQVSAGVYELICLPLKIADGSGDGAPARVVLRSVG